MKEGEKRNQGYPCLIQISLNFTFSKISLNLFERRKKCKRKKGNNGINEFSIELKKKRNTSKLYYYHQRKLSANPNSNCVKEINKSKITLAPRLPTNRDFLPSFLPNVGQQLSPNAQRVWETAVGKIHKGKQCRRAKS